MEALAQMALAASALRAPLTQRGSLGPLRDLLYDSRLGCRRQLLEHFQAPEHLVESHVSARLRGEHRPWGTSDPAYPVRGYRRSPL